QPDNGSCKLVAFLVMLLSCQGDVSFSQRSGLSITTLAVQSTDLSNEPSKVIGVLRPHCNSFYTRKCYRQRDKPRPAARRANCPHSQLPNRSLAPQSAQTT